MNLQLMNHAIPEGARAVARVLLVGPGERLLLLHAEHAADGHTFWLTPGGGLGPDESFEDAARRELREETGVDAQIGRWVWTRRHVYLWNGRLCDQYERFFVATTDHDRIRSIKRDDYVIGHRWWTARELRSSREDFVPRRMAALVEHILEGAYPDRPIDCGV